MLVKRFLAMTLSLMLAVPAVAKYQGRLDTGTWKQSWNDTLKKSLNASTLLNHKESQIDKLCPKYRNDKKVRMTFWQQLFVSLAWKESLHGPSNYIKFNKGINKGLYQVDPTLRKAYGCDGFDLYDPLSNIKCAVKMAQKLVNKDGSFLKGDKGGMAAYWQPLRSTSKRNTKDRAFILGQASTACKTGKITYNSTSKNLIGLEDLLEEASLVPNTTEDLGLSADELESPAEDRSIDEAPNFDIEPDVEF